MLEEDIQDPLAATHTQYNGLGDGRNSEDE